MTMQDIFETNELYPYYDVSFKDHFKGHFEEVLVCFSPFFTIGSGGNAAVQASRIISLDDLQEQDELFKKLEPTENRIIYASNPQYPDAESILRQGKTVSWQFIIDSSPLKDCTEINKALRTSIGALKKDFERNDLTNLLNEFTLSRGIYPPIEGRITILSLIAIYNCLLENEIYQIVVTDEFLERKEEIDITGLSLSEFVSEVRGFMYIYAEDKSILFSIEWDSFFFIICGRKQLLSKLLDTKQFEGFLCNNETYHGWDYE